MALYKVDQLIRYYIILTETDILQETGVRPRGLELLNWCLEFSLETVDSENAESIMNQILQYSYRVLAML